MKSQDIRNQWLTHMIQSSDTVILDMGRTLTLFELVTGIDRERKGEDPISLSLSSQRHLPSEWIRVGFSKNEGRLHDPEFVCMDIHVCILLDPPFKSWLCQAHRFNPIPSQHKHMAANRNSPPYSPCSHLQSVLDLLSLLLPI